MDMLRRSSPWRGAGAVLGAIVALRLCFESAPPNRLPRGRDGVSNVPGARIMPPIAPAGLAFAAAKTAKPTAEALMTSLGRELWLASDDLLSMCALMPGSAPVATMAISLRNAADLMLEDGWEEVMAELENAAISGERIVPPGRFQGLVDLFAYDQPVPEVEWLNARTSLWYVANAIKSSCKRLVVSDEQEVCLESAVATLLEAMRLFENGGFYTPPDPREMTSRERRGHKKTWEAREGSANRPRGSGAAFPSQNIEYMRKRLREEVLKDVDSNVYAGTVARLTEVDQQLQQVAVDGKSKLMRKMLRDLHPDQNPGKEAEVTPVFQYVQKLRDLEK